MKKIFFYIFSFYIFLFFPCFVFASENIIISQFQVSGTSASDEFIELYNPTNKDINLFDYKIQKKSSSGASYNIVTSIPEGNVIKPFHYFLIAHQNFSLKSFIAPDLYYSNFSIANDNSIILYDSDGVVLDIVGFGSVSLCEDRCLNNILSGESYVRSLDYYNYGYGYGYGFNPILCNDIDSNNNSKDFIILHKSSPRNSSFTNECKYIPSSSNIVTNNTTQVAETKTNNDFVNIFSKNNIKNYVIEEDVILDNTNNVVENNLIEKESVENNDVINVSEKNIVNNVGDISNKNNIKNTKENISLNIVEIDDIQNLNIGDKVSFYGIVSSIPGDFSNKYFYLNGVQVYNFSGSFPKLAYGDKVYISGEASSNYGEKRIKIKNSSDVTIISRNNRIDEFDLYNDGEDFENLIAKIVYISGNVSRKSSNKIFLLNDDIETEVYFSDKISSIYKTIKVGDYIKVFGVLNKRNDSYRIMPRKSEDISFVEDEINIATVNTEEENGEQNDLDNKNKQEYVDIKKEDNLEKMDNKNSKIDSYVVSNINNKNQSSFLLYYFIGFVLFVLFIFVLFLYKISFFKKINIAIKLFLNKIKNNS